VPAKHRRRTPLQVRHDAAIALVERGELDPAIALSLVVWPPKGRLEDEYCPTERQFYSEELKAEIRERHAAGETLPDLARKTGVSFGSVKSIAARDAEKAQVPAGVQAGTGARDGAAVRLTPLLADLTYSSRPVRRQGGPHDRREPASFFGQTVGEAGATSPLPEVGSGYGSRNRRSCSGLVSPSALGRRTARPAEDDRGDGRAGGRRREARAATSQRLGRAASLTS
jgi:hypothetical protein